MLVDCHCHLSFPEFSSDLESLLEKIEEGFYGVIESTINLENTKKALATLSQYEFIYFSLGWHPYYAEEFRKEVIEEYLSIIKNFRRIVSIGEVGLDVKSKASLEEQKKVFLEFVDLAVQLDLPLVIHNRGFKDTIISILREKKIKKVVFHCFSGDLEFMDWAVKNGYFISFAGNLTFTNSYGLRECAKKAPLESILVETDSPFLAPQKVRGKRNNPFHVKDVLEEVSRQKLEEFSRVEEAVLRNAKEVFKL